MKSKNFIIIEHLQHNNSNSTNESRLMVGMGRYAKKFATANEAKKYAEYLKGQYDRAMKSDGSMWKRYNYSVAKIVTFKEVAV